MVLFPFNRKVCRTLKKDVISYHWIFTGNANKVFQIKFGKRIIIEFKEV